jgi:NTE family protein
MNIGLTLSGGGFRATVFHLGVLARLAEEERLEQITLLSTVSGGSLCAGLVYAKSDFRWPSSGHLIDQVIPQTRELLTTQDLTLSLFWRALQSPLKIFDSRAQFLSDLLKKRWGVTALLRDLPSSPRWMINATCYETAKNWRFEQFRMGDYVFGYSYDTHVPVSDAITASAGFPGLIGALPFATRGYPWFKYIEPMDDASMGVASITAKKIQPIQPPFSDVHLWDGGAYDNFGLEGVVDPLSGWQHGIEFLIVSDAAGKTNVQPYQRGSKALLRIIADIMMAQVHALRSRMVIERIVNHKNAGAFLQTGKTCRQVLAAAGRERDLPNVSPHCLSDDQAARVANAPTMIGRLSSADFELFFRHGFEVADYTLYAYHPDEFKYIGYANSHWTRKN